MFDNDLEKIFYSISDVEKMLIENPNYAEELFSNKTVGRGGVESDILSISRHIRFFDLPRHKHDYIEMIYVYQGSLTQCVNDKAIVLNTGELMLLNKNVYHEIKASTETDIILNFKINPNIVKYLYGAFFIENKITNFLQSVELGLSKKPEYLYFQIGNIDSCQNKIHEIIDVFFMSSDHAQVKIKFLLGLLIVELIENGDKLISSNTDSFEVRLVRKVFNYIDENYQTASLHEISQLLHYDYSSIGKIIKETTGSSFKELVQGKRIDVATELLIKSTCSIDLIINQIGYENYTYFYQIFKKKYDCSPKEYRELHQVK